MALDADLVREAEAARERLIESQHAAEQAQADYHHAIRRLHAAGGSLREIAMALHLSHLRVHQIIDAGDEPARRRWRRRRHQPGPAGPCSFCGRSPDEGARLIAGPQSWICDACVARATRLVRGAVVTDQEQVPLLVEPPHSGATCSFCGKRVEQVRRLVVSGRASAPGGKFGQAGRICDQCLTVCEEILAHTAPS
jgi:hypothetical protein